MRQLQLVSLVAFLSLTCTSYAQSAPMGGNPPRQVPTDSTFSTLVQPKQQRTMCPQMTVNGEPLSSKPYSVTLIGQSCQPMGGGNGGVGWGGALGIIIMGGYLSPNCTSDYPYLTGFTEQWGGTFFWVGSGGGAGIPSYYCCPFPLGPSMSLKAGNNSGNTYWQDQCQ